MLGGACGRGTVPTGEILDGITEIAEQMPAIRNLHCVGSALTNAIGISASTIAGNDFDAGLTAQPAGDSGSFAVRKQINDLVRFQVYEHGAVAVSALPGPIVHPEDPGCWRRWFIDWSA